MGGSALATYTKRKGPALVLLCIPPIIGIVMLLCIPHTAKDRGPLLVGYYLVRRAYSCHYPHLFSRIHLLTWERKDIILPWNLPTNLLLVLPKHRWRNKKEDHHSRPLHRPKRWQHHRTTSLHYS